jgi:hypothetical protein
LRISSSIGATTCSYLKDIVQENLLKPRQSFRITLYFPSAIRKQVIWSIFMIKPLGEMNCKITPVTKYSAFGKLLCTCKRYWKWFIWTIVSKNWIKHLQTLPVLHFTRCLNCLQWSNSTLQRQLRYWQPNLRTVT